MTLQDKTVMVTGATGLLGAATLRLLMQQGRMKLRACARDREKVGMFADDPVQTSVGDITDRDAVRRAMAGCDVVIHSVMAGGEDDNRRVNVDGTRNVLEAAVEQGVERLVHISSVAAYHPVSDGIVDEDHPQEPDGSGTSYHDTKLESELMALEYGRDEGVAVVVLQPVAVYGPRCYPWTIRVLDQVRDHAVLLVDEDGTSHNVVYVDDVARAMVLAAGQDGVAGECFIVSGGEDVLSTDFYRAHERMLGTPCVAVATGQELDSLGGDLAALARLKGLPGDRPVITAGFGSKVHYSGAKASRLLGFEPAVDIATGMSLTEAWARESSRLR